MLKINTVPVPDLRDDDNMAEYAERIKAALVALVEKVGEDLDEQTRQLIVAQLVTWSYDGSKSSYASWDRAVQAAHITSRTGGMLGVARQSVALSRGEQGFKMAMGSVNWANCGKTSDNVLFELKKIHDGLAEQLKTDEPVMILSSQGALVEKMLSELPPKGAILLFDCTFPQVHTFVIEVHPNGARYLCQGYQGAYYANWWTGKDDMGLIIGAEQDKGITAQDRERLFIARDAYGCGHSIAAEAYQQMVIAIAKALDVAGREKDVDDYKEETENVEELKVRESAAWRAFAALWLDMPFFPAKREADSVASRGGKPSMLITRNILPDITGGAGASICVPVVPNTILG